MNRPEINPDEAIGRLFEGLRNVEPPKGMERRILGAATERSATHCNWIFAWPFATAKTWRSAVASVAIVAIGIAWFMSRDHRIKDQSAEIRRHERHEVPAAAPSPQTSLADASTPQSRPVKRSLRTTPRQIAPAFEKLSDEDALAVSEMNAPSRPAPPLPLTHQEKLLAEAVHQAGPEELGSLQPEVRARQMELSKAEFHNFFEPPAKDNE